MITGPVQTQLAILFFFLSTGAAITSLCISLIFCATSHCTCKLGYLKQGRVFSPPLLTECSVWKECLKQEKRQVFYIFLTVHFIPDLNEQTSKHRCSGFALHSQALKSAFGLISMAVVLLTSHLVTRNRWTVLDILSGYRKAIIRNYFLPLSIEGTDEPLDVEVMTGSIPLVLGPIEDKLEAPALHSPEVDDPLHLAVFHPQSKCRREGGSRERSSKPKQQSTEKSWVFFL